MIPLILASASPRRKELFEKIRFANVKHDEDYAKHGYQQQEISGDEFVAVEEADESLDDDYSDEI